MSRKAVRLNAFVSRIFVILLMVLTPIAGNSEPPRLDGATFGRARVRPLVQSIGPRGVVSVRGFLRVGGVAFVREAIGRDGWSVTALGYDTKSPDGQRLAVTLTRTGGGSTTIRPRVYDWEFIPVARFVVGSGDSAFTYFGEYTDGRETSEDGPRPLGYHPAFSNTLLGLRLMQLDLMMFKEPFAGYFRSSDSKILLGGGEAAVFARVPSGISSEKIAEEVDRNKRNMQRANQFLEENCLINRSAICRIGGQPHQSYVIGDMMDSVRYTVRNGKLIFGDQPICWQFWREADAGEVTNDTITVRTGTVEEGGPVVKIAVLDSLSREFCQQVRMNFNGIHPLAYRSGVRTMRYAALFRAFKRSNPKAYAPFVTSLSSVKPKPFVETPTEVNR